MYKIKLIIFDLDGVLVDSSPAIIDCFNRALKEVDEKPLDENRIKEMIGTPLHEMFSVSLPTEKLHLVDNCFDVYIERFVKTCVRNSTLYPGVEPTLVHFISNGIKISLATTKYAEEARILLNGLGLDTKKFSLILGSKDVKNPKPDPEIIKKTLRMLRVGRENAIIVGDTFYDIKAGKAARISTIAVTYGFGKKGDLEREGPDFIIDSIEDLKDII